MIVILKITHSDMVVGVLKVLVLQCGSVDIVEVLERAGGQA